MTTPKTHLLHRAAYIFNGYTNTLLKGSNTRSDSKTIEFLQAIARFAWQIHTGRFTDPLVENKLLEIGKNLDEFVQVDNHDLNNYLNNLEIKPKTPEKRNVLHIITTSYPVGGHIKMLNNFVKLDNSSIHHLIITRQEDTDFPQWLEISIEESGGEIFKLHHKDILVDAQAVRIIAQKKADLVFLHHHPDDPIPNIAFAVESCPPVSIINHADHAYWLGTNIADLIVNTRERASVLSNERRSARHSMILPIPLDYDPASKISKTEARNQLKIPEDAIIAITMGHYYKFIPNNQYNFFKTVAKVVDAIPEFYLKVIGISENDDLNKIGFIQHERIQLLGVIENPAVYQIAADIVIDPLPYGSYIALLESVAHGCYPVILKNALPLFDLSQDLGLKGLVTPLTNEEEFKSFLIRICSDKNSLDEETRKIKTQLLDYHSGKKWHNHLKSIYDYLEKANHNPAVINANPPQQTDEDVLLNELGSIQFEQESEKLLFHIFQNCKHLSFMEILKLIPTIKKLCYKKSFLYTLRSMARPFKRKII